MADDSANANEDDERKDSRRDDSDHIPLEYIDRDDHKDQRKSEQEVEVAHNDNHPSHPHLRSSTEGGNQTKKRSIDKEQKRA